MNQIINLLKKYQKFLTFGIIGAINTILAQVFYMIFVYLGWMGVSLASIVADCVTMVVSYVLNMKFTYHEKMTLKNALSYPIAYIPGILLTSFITWLVAYFGINKLFAKAICLPITVPLNYVLVSLSVKLSAKVNPKRG